MNSHEIEEINQPHGNQVHAEERHVGPNRSLHGQVGNAAIGHLLQQAVGGGGRPLDDHIRDSMEGHFGVPFDDVRVHTGPGANQSARAVHAYAYTVGSDIVFRDGAYRPGDDAGRRRIAHELTHVVQQRRGHVGAESARGVHISDPSDPLELEAGRVADEVVRRGGLDGSTRETQGDGDHRGSLGPSVAMKSASQPRNRGHGSVSTFGNAMNVRAIQREVLFSEAPTIGTGPVASNVRIRGNFESFDYGRSYSRHPVMGYRGSEIVIPWHSPGRTGSLQFRAFVRTFESRRADGWFSGVAGVVWTARAMAKLLYHFDSAHGHPIWARPIVTVDHISTSVRGQLADGESESPTSQLHVDPGQIFADRSFLSIPICLAVGGGSVGTSRSQSGSVSFQGVGYSASAGISHSQAVPGRDLMKRFEGRVRVAGRPPAGAELL